MITLTARAKVTDLSDQDILCLSMLGYFATKLWNVANMNRNAAWGETGKIPSFYDQCKSMKDNRWCKLLPSQTSQEILAELDDSYRSWFKLRKNGDKKARPPGYRRRTELSTVTFKQNAFAIVASDQVELRLPSGVDRESIRLSFILPRKVKLGLVKQVKLSYDALSGDWYLHITYWQTISYQNTGNAMALDLGIVNIIAGMISTGQTFFMPGGELLALDRYFHKEKAKCNKSSSKKCRNLNHKWSVQRNHYLHSLSKRIVEIALSNNVSVIVIGDLKGIRQDKNWGAKGNQKLHAWPFEKLTQLITYKAALAGIRVATVSERNTSTTCPVCGKRSKSARVQRGLFLHCGQAYNADLVGAHNILQRYLRESDPAFSVRTGVVGALARPAVNLFVWRESTPLGRGQGTFRCAA
jgi:putative transposase